MNKSARILALDPSTQSTGWCIVDPLKEQPQDRWHYGVLKVPPKEHTTGIAACWQQHDLLHKFLFETQMRLALPPDTLIVWEGMFAGRGGKLDPQMIFLLGELRGLLRGVLDKFGWREIIVIPPHRLSSFMGLPPNTRRIIKKRAARQSAASLLWGDRALWKNISEDEADAILLARIADYDRTHVQATMPL